LIQLLDHADDVRRTVASGIAIKRKSQLGQFMTPAPVARFMASLFPPSTLQTCKLLDAGAGVGALTCAFLDRWATGEFRFERTEVEAYEIDQIYVGILKRLWQTMRLDFRCQLGFYPVILFLKRHCKEWLPDGLRMRF
jgi:hypothetical protein